MERGCVADVRTRREAATNARASSPRSHEAPDSDAPWARHQFVFVGGLHRSGTTLVADILRNSPTTAGLVHTGAVKDEGQFLQDVYPTGRQMGGSTRWTRDPRFHLIESDADLIPDAAERLWRSWHPYFAHPAPLLVEKSPQNLTKTLFLQRIFPNSSFIMITRHPVTQALSQSKWSSGIGAKIGLDLFPLVEQWVRAHEAFRDDCAALSRVYVVRFEDLSSRPNVVVGDILGFLGIDGQEGNGAEIDSHHLDTYISRWRSALADRALMGAGREVARAVPAGRIDKNAVRRVLDAAVLPATNRRVRRLLGERVANLGYDFEALDKAEPWQAGPSWGL